MSKPTKLWKVKKTTHDNQFRSNFIGFDDQSKVNNEECNSDVIQSFSSLNKDHDHWNAGGLFSHLSNCEQMMKLHQTGNYFIEM